MIFSVFSTVGIIPLGICSDVASEDTDWIISISQDLILPLTIRTKSHSLPLSRYRRNAKKRNLSQTVRATTLMKASLTISTPQRLFISVLENLDYPTAFMIRIKKSVQNIIRRLRKSAVGNGQKCNCVMIRLMLLP